MIDLQEFKKFFVFNLIGSLIISALVAVVTVLIGKFNEVTTRVLFTLFMVVVHSLVCLAFIWDREKKDTLGNLDFFSNIIFFIVVLSFITSIMGIWKIIPGDIVGKVYYTFFLVAIASIHVNMLYWVTGKKDSVNWTVYINYFFIAVVVLMYLPIIYMDDVSLVFGDFYYRLLGAAAIIDGTCSVLAIILYKLYLHNLPIQAKEN